MKKSLTVLPILIIFFIVSCNPTHPITLPTITEIEVPSTNRPQSTPTPFLADSQITEETFHPTETAVELQPTPTPDLFLKIYGCEMEIKFVSGPLEDKTTELSVLVEDYFTEKGDKFAVGKGTGIFYKDQRYFILHSSYVRGNVLRPMEAEFIRKYLENWGSVGPEFIQGQIDALVGSEVHWICDGVLTFETKINGVVRLSHQASDRLWLEPEHLQQILLDREGLVSEWIGEINEQEDETFYLGFCGWGPKSLESGRYTYYRYLISFDPIH